MQAIQQCPLPGDDGGDDACLQLGLGFAGCLRFKVQGAGNGGTDPNSDPWMMM